MSSKIEAKNVNFGFNFLNIENICKYLPRHRGDLKKLMENSLKVAVLTLL